MRKIILLNMDCDHQIDICHFHFFAKDGYGDLSAVIERSDGTIEKDLDLKRIKFISKPEDVNELFLEKQGKILKELISEIPKGINQRLQVAMRVMPLVVRITSIDDILQPNEVYEKLSKKALAFTDVLIKEEEETRDGS